MTWKIYIFFNFLIIFLNSNARAELNWQDPQWIKLLHYQKRFNGDYVSEADGENFFISRNGKFSPQDELSSFIDSLVMEEPNEQKNTFCRFPARVRWLKKRGYKLPNQKTKCQDLEKFRTQVSARSIFIVFSTYFLGNPASSFGHTFMRLGKNETSSLSHELMDTGVSYSADTGSAGFFSYIIKGLTGGFSGEFRTTPYYTKVHEYNNSELRDLWSYQIDFTQDEIDILVDHIWELGPIHFDYFFLTENCSYHMLTLLEAAKPELELVNDLPNYYVIPADTLKAIHNQKMIKSVSYRPSSERVSIQMKKFLLPEEIAIIPDVIKNPKIVTKFDNYNAAVLLDAALVQLEISKQKELLMEQPNEVKLQEELMLTRSKIPVRSPSPNYDDLLVNKPHKGHDSRRFNFGSLSRNDKIWTTFGLRAGLHDIMDFERSYLPNSSLEMFELTARSNGQIFQIEEYALLNMLNLKQITDPNNPLSWKLRIGGGKNYFKSSERDKFGVSAGVGITKSIGPATGYIIPLFEMAYFSPSKNKVSPSTGGDLGFYFSIIPTIRIHTMMGVRDGLWNESFFQNEIRFSELKYGFGIQNNYYLSSEHHELKLLGVFYF